MEKIYLIIADNGQDYSDHRDWPCFYVTNEADAISIVKKLNEEICKLYEKAQDHSHTIDYAVAFDEHASGKRYEKYLKRHGIIDKEDSVSWNQYNVRYQEIPKGTSL
jgi:hypothetical protein